jgi:hypothetical protein
LASSSSKGSELYSYSTRRSQGVRRDVRAPPVRGSRLVVRGDTSVAILCVRNEKHVDPIASALRPRGPRGDGLTGPGAPARGRRYAVRRCGRPTRIGDGVDVRPPCGSGCGSCARAGALRHCGAWRIHQCSPQVPNSDAPPSALDAATKVQAAGTERTNLPRNYQRLRPLKNLSEAAAKEPAIDSASSESPSGVQILMGMVIGLSMPKFS